jgi:aspartate/methionine/tyrosine aminotransferase
MFHRGQGSNADMAGTPCGEMCESAQGQGRAPLIAAINELLSQTSSCPSSISQVTAAHSLVSDQSFVRDCVRLDKARRDCARARLTAIVEGHDQAGL